MKVGIYISGLGQSFEHESVDTYVARFKNELNYTKTGSYFDMKSEKITYSGTREATVVSIFEKTGEKENIIYKFYEFDYRKLITEKFTGRNIFVKNLLLFLLVIRKFPMLIRRLFVNDGYNRTGQTLYVFGVFFLISFAILFLIPSTILFVNDFNFSHKLSQFFDSQILNYIIEKLDFIAKMTIPLTTFVLLVIPESKVIITSLATEFACADSYIQYGEQSQIVLGNLDLLVEYIAEHDKDSKIHLHSYSFGTILAIDFLFPFGNVSSDNSKKLIELLITIGSPYEFVKAYYPKFYEKRGSEMSSKIDWINVYSVSDALATNFRKDNTIGEAEFGIKNITLLPTNINYEIGPLASISIMSFLSLYHIRVHKFYWDAATEGQSCMRMLFDELEKKHIAV